MYSKYKITTEDKFIKVRECIDFHIELRVKFLMDQKDINIAEMARVSGLRYETVKSYYNDEIVMIDRFVIAVFCKVLKCKLSDVLVIVYDDIKIKNQEIYMQV